MASTEDQLPFWMHQNQRDRIAKNTNLVSWISGKGFQNFSNNSVLEIGTGLLVREGTGDDFFVDEFYAHYKTKFWSFTAGRKQQEELYNGLSASNRSILWSLNARPLPGLQLKTTRPVFLFKNFGFEATWEEYIMDDERFVDNARLHHKSFHFVYSTADRDFQFKAGIQHFAQWGGDSPTRGSQESFEDYLRIFTGRGGGQSASIGDQQNALGNHIGGYELYLSKSFTTFKLDLIYNHLFEDGSGSRLVNTPDGRYGIFISSNKSNKLLNILMYEFFTTHHQSHTSTGPHKTDDYFNNTGYRSGWTYYNRVLGAPFFTVNPDELGIINNKFTAHHLGLGGIISVHDNQIPYKLLLSYAQNDGRRHIRYNPKQDVVYALYDIKLLKKEVELNLQFAVEYDNYKAPVYGAGVQVVYRIE